MKTIYRVRCKGISWTHAFDTLKAAQLCAATDWRFAGVPGTYIQKVETTPAPLI